MGQKGSLSEGDTITLTFGGELYAPVQYNNWTLGPFTMGTTIRKGETEDDAIERLQTALNKHAKAEYERKSVGFLKRLRKTKADARG